MKEYYWNFDENEEHWENSCDSISECLEEAKYENKTYENNEKCHVFIGECEIYTPRLDGIQIIETLQQDACEQDDVYGEYWLDEVGLDEVDSLQNRINEVLSEWLKETNNIPDFGEIVNIKEYSLETESESE